MSRNTRFIVAAVLVSLLLLGLSLLLHSWGGILLLVAGAVAVAWYRAQVAQGEAAERFFGDMGDETRLTNFQAGGASDMPLDATLPGTARRPVDRP